MKRLLLPAPFHPWLYFSQTKETHIVIVQIMRMNEALPVAGRESGRLSVYVILPRFYQDHTAA